MKTLELNLGGIRPQQAGSQEYVPAGMSIRRRGSRSTMMASPATFTPCPEVFTCRWPT